MLFQGKIMQLLLCTLPLPRQFPTPAFASNADQLQRSAGLSNSATHTTLHGNVRWMQSPQNTDPQRIALSGKLSDVCAALDELAAQEIRNIWRTASC